MKEFENIQKRMPYRESDDYVKQLIDHATDQAINKAAEARQPRAKTRSMRWMAAAAAVAAVMALAGIAYNSQPTAYDSDTLTAMADYNDDRGPIDDFLDNLSDEEAQLLAYYEIEEIPEIEN